MVKTREDWPRTAAGDIDIQRWVQHFAAHYPSEQLQNIQKACELGLATDTEHLGLAMADVLSDLSLDPDTLIAAILFPAMRENPALNDVIAKQFKPSVRHLLAGVEKMDALQVLKGKASTQESSPGQLDKLRKMLLAMVEDARVVLIKLAEHLCMLRNAKTLDDAQRRQIAKQSQDIFGPLANRLGIGQIKWEMEDLAFRYLEVDAYKRIAHLLHEKRVDREDYIKRVIKTLHDALNEENIHSDVTGRVKHIYSIWRKMRRKNVDYSEIYDVRAVRILVDNVRDCYTALGIVHHLWPHIPREFDDYIATPKKNGYRSLHTAVIGPEGKTVEVQIRTNEMHSDSELGVAAHWVYKEGVAQKDSYESKIAWMRQLLETPFGGSGSEDLIAELRSNVMEDRVYVLTPKGEVQDLPKGATPLDFAYQVHTEIGHRCRGAKINARIVPLTHILNTGDQVEVLTGPHANPSRDWLNPNLGYLKTTRGRAKVHQWFRLQNRDQNIIEGKQLLDRELQRLGIRDFELTLPIIQKLNFNADDELYAALGSGDFRLSQVLNAMQAAMRGSVTALPVIPLTSKKVTQAQNSDQIMIEGVGNLLTQIAHCCRPLPGDPIIGYITQGRGVSIHRQDCPNILHVQEKREERLIKVSWNTAGIQQTYPAIIKVTAYDRTGLLKDVTSLLANEKVNILAMQTVTNKDDNRADVRVTVEVADLRKLVRVLERLAQLPNVYEVERCG